ncbi:MAG: type VI secretion system contractile sheath small subunit [Gammaproteobacteria bacterium]|nr:type VI secretion system contractile sheath small subunit [Gammaproteobacteria bacterium]MBU1482078.1 type VI secretion system contractile sheath small subunit [Gammaproteobacteria bacterium]
MADSFQNEIPKARVNISLDVETYGAKRKVELPHKALVIGDFSMSKTQRRVGEQERINIDANNIEQVMTDLAPAVNFAVPNKITNDGSEIRVDIQFNNFKSFHPEQVARQVPELAGLLAMRNLLKDLKSNLLDNTAFRKELEQIVKSQPELASLRKELEGIAPIVAKNDPVAG